MFAAITTVKVDQRKKRCQKEIPATRGSRRVAAAGHEMKEHGPQTYRVKAKQQMLMINIQAPKMATNADNQSREGTRASKPAVV